MTYCSPILISVHPTQTSSSPVELVVTELLVNHQVCLPWFCKWLKQSLPWEIVTLDRQLGLAQARAGFMIFVPGAQPFQAPHQCLWKLSIIALSCLFAIQILGKTPDRLSPLFFSCHFSQSRSPAQDSIIMKCFLTALFHTEHYQIICVYSNDWVFMKVESPLLGAPNQWFSARRFPLNKVLSHSIDGF